MITHLPLTDSQNLLPSLLTQAQCLLWSAEVRRDLDQNLVWEVQYFDHHVFAEAIPLEGVGERYVEAWFEAIPLLDRRQIEAASRQALERGEERYRVRYQLRDRHNQLHQLQEEARVQPIAEGLWRVVGLVVETTERHYHHDLLQLYHRALEARDTGQETAEALAFLLQDLSKLLPESQHLQLLRLDPATQKLFPLGESRVPESITEALTEGFAIGPAAASFGTAAFRKEPVLVEDIRTSPLWKGHLPQVWELCGLRSCWAYPLVDPVDAVLGTLVVYFPEARTPSPKEREALQAAAHLAGLLLQQAPEAPAQEPAPPSEPHLHAVLASASEGFVLVDAATEQVLELSPLLSGLFETTVSAESLAHLVERLGFTPEGIRRLVRRSLRHVQPLRLTLPSGSLRELELQTARTRVGQSLLLCVTLRDVTERNHQRALQNHLLAGAHCLLWSAQTEWQGGDPGKLHLPIEFVHPEAAARFLGLLPELNLALADIWLQGISETDRRKRLHNLHQALANNQNYSQEFVYVSPQGESRVLREDVSLERLSPGHWRLIGVCNDVTSAHQAQQLIFREANYDALTILPNRKFFVEQLQEALSTLTRSRETLAVLFLDIDRFKNVNDTLGHVVGDQILALAAQRLRLLAEPKHLVARLGGDEFILLVRHVSSPEMVEELAKELCRILRQPFQVRDSEFFLAASIGIRLINDALDYNITTDTILRQADIAMHRAKEAGGDTCEFYQKTMENEARERLGLEASLYHAVERGELVLHYQPQYSCQGGPVVGVEALVRWQHPEGGLLMPVNFIELAEETGLILEIGAWVIQNACRQAALWRSLGLPVCVSVNLSGRQLQQRSFPEMVGNALRESQLPPEFLNLELTETMLVRQTTTVQKVLDELQDLGVKMEVDDFGTGFSSLVTLRRFRMHSLKIDRSFVQGMTEEPEDRIIVQGVIDLAHALGMQVIAEGVETTAQRNLLIEMGCDRVQGYLFGYPMPAESLTELLKATAGLAQKRTLLRAA